MYYNSYKRIRRELEVGELKYYFIGLNKSKAGSITGYYVLREDGFVLYNKSFEMRECIKSGVVDGLRIENNKIESTNGSFDRYPFTYTGKDHESIPNGGYDHRYIILEKVVSKGRTIGFIGAYLSAEELSKCKDAFVPKKCKIVAVTEKQLIEGIADGKICNGKIVEKNGIARVYAISGNFSVSEVTESYEELVKRVKPWSLSEFIYVIESFGGIVSHRAEMYGDGPVSVKVPASGMNIPVLRCPLDVNLVEFEGGKTKIGLLRVERAQVEISDKDANIVYADKCIIERYQSTYAESVRIKIAVGALTFGGKITKAKYIQIDKPVRLFKIPANVESITSSFNSVRGVIGALDLSEMNANSVVRSSFCYTYSEETVNWVMKVKLGGCEKYYDSFIGVGVEIYGEFPLGIERLTSFSHIMNWRHLDFSRYDKLIILQNIGGPNIGKISFNRNAKKMIIGDVCSYSPLGVVEIQTDEVVLSGRTFGRAQSVVVGNKVTIENLTDNGHFKVLVRGNKERIAEFPIIKSGNGSIRIEIEEGVERLRCGFGVDTDSKYGTVSHIKFPKTLKYINESVFSDITILSTNLEETQLEEIFENTFRNTDVRALVLPRSLTCVRRGAFKGRKAKIVYFPETIRQMEDDAYDGAVALLHEGSIADKRIKGVRKVYVGSEGEALAYINQGESAVGAATKVKLVAASDNEAVGWANSPVYRDHIALLSEINNELKSVPSTQGNVRPLFTERLINFPVEKLGIFGEYISREIGYGGRKQVNVTHEFSAPSDVYMNLLNYIMATTVSYVGMFTSAMINMEADMFNNVDEFGLDAENVPGEYEKLDSIVYKDNRSAIVLVNIKAGVPWNYRSFAKPMYALVAVEEGMIKYATVVEYSDTLVKLVKAEKHKMSCFNRFIVGDTVYTGVKEYKYTCQLRELPTGLEYRINERALKSTLYNDRYLYCLITGRAFKFKKINGENTVVSILGLTDLMSTGSAEFRLPQDEAIEYFNILNGKKVERELEYKSFILAEIMNKYSRKEMNKEDVERYLIENETKYKVSLPSGQVRRHGYRTQDSEYISVEKPSNGKISGAMGAAIYVIMRKDAVGNNYYSDKKIEGTLSRFNIPLIVANLEYDVKIVENVNPVPVGEGLYANYMRHFRENYGMEHWDTVAVSYMGEKYSIGVIASYFDNGLYLVYKDMSNNKGYRIIGRVLDPDEALTEFDSDQVRYRRSDKTGNENKERAEILSYGELTRFAHVLANDYLVWDDLERMREGRDMRNVRPYYALRLSKYFRLLGL